MSSFAVVLRDVADNLPVRGSMRSRGAAAMSTVTLRQISAVLPPERAWGLWASRQIVARRHGLLRPVAGRNPASSMSTCGCPTAAGSSANGCARRACRRGKPRDLLRARQRIRAVLAPHPPPADGMAVPLTGLPVFVVDYRLAPRHRFPAAADDVRTGWDWLTDQHGFAPERMVIAGDSAGGHLAVDLLLQPDVAPSGGHGPDVAADRPHLRAGARPRRAAA